MLLPALAALSIAAPSAAVTDRLAMINDLMLEPQSQDECLCTVERVQGEDNDETCTYSYECTNMLSGETSASCQPDVAVTQITDAACNTQ